MNNNFTTQEVYAAYRRMKSYFYYDSTNLFIRRKIADFENRILDGKTNDKTLNKLQNLFGSITDVLNKFMMQGGNMNVLKPWMSEISYILVPKEMKNDNKAEDTERCKSRFVTNRISQDEIIVGKYNILIDASIELHIITFLWVEYVGVKLSNRICDNNYAYQLNITEDYHTHVRSLAVGLNVVKPYFMGYKQWRDNALQEAKQLVDSGNDVTMLSLDIKRYFYSLRLNVYDIYNKYLDKTVYGDISENEQRKIDVLNKTLQDVHEEYHRKIIDLLSDKGSEKDHYTVLPVGLISSGILGNVCLSEFDEAVKTKVCPHYYGRYVDDMLFVFSNHSVDNDNAVEKFIDDYFCKKSVLIKRENPKYVSYVISREYVVGEDLTIQSEKIVMQHFEHTGSHAAINLFMNDVNMNRSEYRFLPDEDYITREFDNEAYDLLYQDNSHKFRNILDCKQDRYGVAKFLSSQIFLSKLSDTSSDERHRATARQILTFFQSKTAIEMYSLWERVATYFFVSRDYTSLWKFYYNIKHTIECLKYDTECNFDNGIGDKLTKSLVEHLNMSVAMAFALCPQILTYTDKDAVDIMNISCRLRLSNMFRINNVGVLGINLTECLLKNSVNLYADDIPLNQQVETVEIIRLLYPTYIHFEEVNMLGLYKYITSCSNEKHNNKSDKQCKSSIYEQMEDDYHKYNEDWSNLFIQSEESSNSNRQRLINTNGEYFNVHETANRQVVYSPDKKVAIVNTKVIDSDFMSVVKYHKPRCSMRRRNELCKVINSAARENCDMLVMPELTVPFEWLKMLADHAKRTNMAIVTGLEYFVDANNTIYNFVATILPVIYNNGVKTSILHLRLKNFYSPKERIVLDGYHFNLPELQNFEDVKYNLFHWRKCYFSVYNCFELADISSRARYQSKVDFIIAVEYNRDTHYYSDIVGSWAHDIHCFIIQVNSSDFGDSKIVMPSKTDNKTMVHIKGGENSAVLVATLPVKRLRDFQLGGYSVQKEDKIFKFTPPSFRHEYARIRFENSDF